jgi:hypothetical protein
MNKDIGACVSLKSPIVGHLAPAAVHILSSFTLVTHPYPLLPLLALSLSLSLSQLSCTGRRGVQPPCGGGGLTPRLNGLGSEPYNNLT